MGAPCAAKALRGRGRASSFAFQWAWPPKSTAGARGHLQQACAYLLGRKPLDAHPLQSSLGALHKLNVTDWDSQRLGKYRQELRVSGSLHRRCGQPDFERLAVRRVSDSADLGACSPRFGPHLQLRAVVHGAEEARPGALRAQLSVPPAFFGARKLMLSSMRGSSAEKVGD